MRDKTRGWSNYGLRFQFADGREHTVYRRENGWLLKCFTDGLLERSRCLRCQYKGDQIRADLLLGDGWRMEELAPELADSAGVSAVLTLTAKGDALLQKILPETIWTELPVQELAQRNHRILTPAPENKKRSQFASAWQKHPDQLHRLLRRYGRGSMIDRGKAIYGKALRKIRKWKRRGEKRQ